MTGNPWQDERSRSAIMRGIRLAAQKRRASNNVARALRVRHYHYIRRARMEDWLRLGWMIVAELGPVHGEWSVLGWWPCTTCKIVRPKG